MSTISQELDQKALFIKHCFVCIHRADVLNKPDIADDVWANVCLNEPMLRSLQQKLKMATCISGSLRHIVEWNDRIFAKQMTDDCIAHLAIKDNISELSDMVHLFRWIDKHTHTQGVPTRADMIQALLLAHTLYQIMTRPSVKQYADKCFRKMFHTH